MDKRENIIRILKEYREQTRIEPEDTAIEDIFALFPEPSVVEDKTAVSEVLKQYLSVPLIEGKNGWCEEYEVAINKLIAEISLALSKLRIKGEGEYYKCVWCNKWNGRQEPHPEVKGEESKQDKDGNPIWIKPHLEEEKLNGTQI